MGAVMRSLIFWFCAICWMAISVVASAWLEKLTGFDKSGFFIGIFVLGGFILLGLIGCLQYFLVQWVVKLRSKGSI